MHASANTLGQISDTRMTWQGACHCKALRFDFYTALLAAQLVPRACDCSFCTKHGAAYLSDPAGTLIVHAAAPSDVLRYRQGAERAEFLCCAHCGILLAALYEPIGKRYAAINAQCLAAKRLLPDAVSASPQTLNAEQKTARWAELWVADVAMVYAAA